VTAWRRGGAPVRLAEFAAAPVGTSRALAMWGDDWSSDER
jgi:hypothetical protein